MDSLPDDPAEKIAGIADDDEGAQSLREIIDHAAELKPQRADLIRAKATIWRSSRMSSTTSNARK